MQRLVFAFLIGAMAMQAQTPSENSPVTRDAQNSSQQRVKEQAILIPQGATVEVRLANGQKLRGRLGMVSDQGLALRSVFENKIDERTLNFAEIKSVHYYNPFRRRTIVSYIIVAASTAASIGLAATH